MANTALYRKYRSQTFDDVVGQEHITGALKNQVSSGRISHAYIFTGTRGTGKTSCAKILARAVNCLSPVGGNPCNECKACLSVANENTMDVMEIDAASNNGVDNIRQIRDECVYSPAALKMRVYIIDEVHMLSAGAFNAMLKILEEPPAHVLFILATTEIHKVPITILSRCQRYDFRRIDDRVIFDRLSMISYNEGVKISDEALSLISRLGDGSMRDAISLLDRSIGENSEITYDSAISSLSIPQNSQIQGIWQAICSENAPSALDFLASAYSQGRDLIAILDNLLSLCRDVYIVTALKSCENISFATSFTQKEITELASKVSNAGLLDYFIDTLNDTLSRVTRTSVRRMDCELCLIKLCSPKKPQAVAVLDTAPPFDLPKSTPQVQTPVATVKIPEIPTSSGRKKPAPKEDSPDDGGFKAKFIAAVGTKVNIAVREILQSSQVILNGKCVVVITDTGNLPLIQRNSVIAALNEVAQSIGCDSAVISDKMPSGNHDSKAEQAPKEENLMDELIEKQRIYNFDKKQ